MIGKTFEKTVDIIIDE